MSAECYREKLWPSPWLFVATALVIPASLGVFAPLSLIVGVFTGIIFYAGCVILLLWTSPVIEVCGGALTAGKAKISLCYVGKPVAYSGSEAQAERGITLDARAWVLIRGWINPVVRIPLTDPSDPTPYWLVSTRKPNEFVAAINSAQNFYAHRSQKKEAN